MVVVIIFSFIIILGIIGYIYFKNIDKQIDEERLSFDHINEDSFQRYAKFFGSVVPTDSLFIQKLNTIYSLIVNNKETNIEIIAKKSNCTLEECVLKIKYLKNKRMLGDYYIDTTNNKIIMCSDDDQKLLDKYKPYIYHSHMQIDEIANVLPNKDYLEINEIHDKVFKELNYLDNKGLLNGLIIDDIDRKITYYTLEKRKEKKGYESIHCPNCGAIVDVLINGKARCGYCNTIIKGSEVDFINEM